MTYPPDSLKNALGDLPFPKVIANKLFFLKPTCLCVVCVCKSDCSKHVIVTMVTLGSGGLRVSGVEHCTAATSTYSTCSTIATSFNNSTTITYLFFGL